MRHYGYHQMVGITLFGFVISVVNALYIGCHSGKCFHVNSTESASWEGARSACENKNMMLASLSTKSINEWLQGTNAANHDVWIGTRAFHLQTWKWITGDTISLGIATNSDDVDMNLESCGFTTYKNGSMNLQLWSGACWQRRMAFCQKSYAQDCVSLGGQAFNNLCFYSISSEITWFKAREECRKNNGDLVIISSNGDGLPPNTDMAKLMLPEKQYWTGAWKQHWSWMDGGYMIWTNWAVNQPAVMWESGVDWAPDSCVVRRLDGYWESRDCNQQLPFICQEDPTKPVLPTTTTTFFTLEVSSKSNTLDPDTVLSGKNNTNIIVSVVSIIVVLLIIAVALGIVYGLRRRKKQEKPDKEYTSNNPSTQPRSSQDDGYPQPIPYPAPPSGNPFLLPLDSSTNHNDDYEDVSDPTRGPGRENVDEVGLSNEGGLENSAEIHVKRKKMHNYVNVAFPKFHEYEDLDLSDISAPTPNVYEILQAPVQH